MDSRGSTLHQQRLNYEPAEEDVTSSTESSDESVEVDMERLSRIIGAYTQEIRKKVQIRLLEGFVGMGTQAPSTHATVAAAAHPEGSGAVGNQRPSGVRRGKRKRPNRRLADGQQPPFKKTSKSRRGEGLSNAPNIGHTSWHQHGLDTENVHLGPPTHLPKRNSTHYF